MKIYFKWILVFGFMAVLAFFVFNEQSTKVVEEKKETIFQASDIKSIKVAGVELKTEVAITGEEKQRGLSGRSALAPEDSMLFVFDQPGKYFFWMKDMNFAIDIIWLNESREIVYIKKDARPESYPESFGPDRYAKYILEVVSGFSDQHNLKEGDKVEFVF